MPRRQATTTRHFDLLEKNSKKDVKRTCPIRNPEPSLYFIKP